MKQKHQTAIAHHCRLAAESSHPRFQSLIEPGVSLVLTINSGWE